MTTLRGLSGPRKKIKTNSGLIVLLWPLLEVNLQTDKTRAPMEMFAVMQFNSS